MRPYLKKSARELERIFKDGATPDILTLLLNELAHRKKPRAVALRRCVQHALSATADTVPSQQSFSFGENNPTVADKIQGPDETLRGKSASRDHRAHDRLADDRFTQIQPLGVAPRPRAWKPPFKNDLDLGLTDSEGYLTRFCVALAALIREMRQRGAGQTQFALEEGVRVNSESSGFSYKFEFTEDANIFDGARVDLLIAGRAEPGRITAIMHDRIIVTLEHDYGNTIHSCILRLDNTALLEALRSRLQAIERGDKCGFQIEFAEKVLTNHASAFSANCSTDWPWRHTPTAGQRQFLDVSLMNEVSWLWGPPGTGKTITLAAVAEVLYTAGERVLICSNTNQAVDQLLLKLCQNAHSSAKDLIEKGHIIRDGRIEGRLKDEFGEYVSIDEVAKRRMALVKQRHDKLQADLAGIESEIATLKIDLDGFANLDSLWEAGKSAKEQFRRCADEFEICRTAVGEAELELYTLRKEYRSVRNAGPIRRMFLRSERQVMGDIQDEEARLDKRKQDNVSVREGVLEAKGHYETAVRNYRSLRDRLCGKDREDINRRFTEREDVRKQYAAELAKIRERLENAIKTILSEARIVGTTVTRAFLRPSQFPSFDTVLIDEASMILLPAVFQAAGLATRRVVIAGDFQQLPPIVQTEQKSIHDILGHDVFEEAGITMDRVYAGSIPRLVMLDEQFRMNPKICNLVSSVFYEGRLKTHEKASGRQGLEPAPLSNPLTIVDTSQISPFTTRNAFRSRLNLMHGLIVRNIVLYLRDQGRLFDKNQKTRVGVCTPYAAQAALIRKILQAHFDDEIRASTVHGFQGDERGVMILDLVDSIGEWYCGIFLQANELGESGAKLLNVAMSRAESGLIIVGNLTYLDQKLPSKAILRGVLHDIQRRGRVIDARDVLPWHPIMEDLNEFQNQLDVDPELLRNSVVRSREFEKVCRIDMEHAKKSIVIFSGFITSNRVARLGDLFRERIAAGIRIRCVTQPPARNGSMSEKMGRDALKSLESLGVAIDLRNNIHEKVVIVDDRIVWFGSLNPLSHTDRTSELMARVDNGDFMEHMTGLLSLRKRSPDDIDRGLFADPENPRCEQCGGWSVLINGRYGRYFQCEAKDGWKQDLDRRLAKRVK